MVNGLFSWLSKQLRNDKCQASGIAEPASSLETVSRTSALWPSVLSANESFAATVAAEIPQKTSARL